MTTTIVVGSGSSGGPLAARLSEDPDQHVILVEAGPDYAGPDALPQQLRDADAFDPALFGHDWGLQGHAVEPPGSRPPIAYPRGRLMGGSSAVNGAVAQRAIPEDLDGWVAAGNDAWSWEACLSFYRRLERDLDFGDRPGHGADGPVPISRIWPAEWPQVTQAFAAACAAMGHPRCDDANAPDATGVGPFPRNRLGRRRASALAAYLDPARSRPNLELRPDTVVDRVLFAGRRAVGVEARHGASTTAERIVADRVVLSAGVVKSPQILMLSGIGPAEHLRRHGIAVLADLPVGCRLVDHPAIAVLAPAAHPQPALWGPRAELQLTSRDGPRNDLWVVPSLVAPDVLGPAAPPGLDALVLLSGAIGKPRSAGHLQLRSSDPAQAPALHLNFLDDPADRRRAREVARLLHELTTRSPVADELGPVLAPIPGDAADDVLDTWLRANVTTALHGACTCPMGPRGEAGAVVDQQLAVHDVDGLYVADASVMPEITTSVINLTCFMIGERMADLLLARG
jgi:choline dehydrogenase